MTTMESQTAIGADERTTSRAAVAAHQQRERIVAGLQDRLHLLLRGGHVLSRRA